MRKLIWLLALVCLASSLNAQSVVINKYLNSGSAINDVIELLVITNDLDMRGMIFKDYSSNMANDNGGAYIFADNQIWASVPAGTLIILRSGVSTAADVNALPDRVIDVGLTNTNFFTAGNGNTFDIATTDFVEIKAAGSPVAGQTGHIHALAAGTAGAQYTAAPSPKLRATGTTGTNFGVYANNATSTAADYDGTGATGNVAGGSMPAFGSGNNATNITYITNLRTALIDDPNIAVKETSVSFVAPVSSNFDYAISISNLTAGGNTLNVTAANFAGPGIALFSVVTALPLNIAPGTTGTLTVRFNSATAVGPTTASVTLVSNDQSGKTPVVALTGQTGAVSSVFVPQYIQGSAATNNNRTIYVFRAALSSLLPNTTYRYINQAINTTETLLAVDGAGNPLFRNSGTLYGTPFVRAGNPDLLTANQYSTFTTDVSGAYTGWFFMEPTSNNRFGVGSQLKLNITINNGAGGTTAAARFRLPELVQVIDYGTAGVNTGTGIYVNDLTSDFTTGSLVLLWDNTGATGRPISGAFVENDKLAAQASWVAWYRTGLAAVDAVPNAWGTIIPNALPNGIRAINNYSVAGTVVHSSTSADGTWLGASATTVNPSGGATTPIKLIGTTVPVELSGFAAE